MILSGWHGEGRTRTPHILRPPGMRETPYKRAMSVREVDDDVENDGGGAGSGEVGRAPPPRSWRGGCWLRSRRAKVTAAEDGGGATAVARRSQSRPRRWRPAAALSPRGGGGDQLRNRSDGQQQGFVQTVADKNLELTMNRVRELIRKLRELAQKGRIGITGAIDDARSGKVAYAS